MIHNQLAYSGCKHVIMVEIVPPPNITPGKLRHVNLTSNGLEVELPPGGLFS